MGAGVPWARADSGRWTGGAMLDRRQCAPMQLECWTGDVRAERTMHVKDEQCPSTAEEPWEDGPYGEVWYGRASVARCRG